MNKKNTCKKCPQEILEYQPDATEIEERPVAGKIRWVLYVILGSLTLGIIGAIIFEVDRIVVAEGSLITTSPTIIVQPLNTAVIRSINVRVGEVVEKDQVLATLDSTFVSSDLSQLTKRRIALESQIRRIRAELTNQSFVSTATGAASIFKVTFEIPPHLVYPARLNGGVK
jgi:HlyD family secretion protein